MSFVRLALGMLAMLGVLGTGQVARADAEGGEVVAAADRPDFTGRYGHVGGEKERQKIKSAIHTATRRLFPGIRGIARRVLRRKLPVASTYTIAVRDEAITIVGDDGISRTAPYDGRWVGSESADGEVLRVRHYFRGVKLVQMIASDRGTRQNTYVLSPTTGELVIHVEVVSDELPETIRYVLTYRRRG